MMEDHGATIIGASCLLGHASGLVLEVQKPHKWATQGDGCIRIGLGCIGGSLEADEGPVEALQREASEEIGCHLELVESPVTYEVKPDGGVRERDWSHGGIRPALVWEACLPGLIPGRKVVVYMGRCGREPEPVDLPALLLVPPELLFAIGSGNLGLADVLARGAELRAREALPDNAELVLVGTPAVLSLLQHRDECLVDRLVELACT
jgi:hypothetical protein